MEANKTELISETNKFELQITEPIDVVRVTKNIEMKRTCEESNEISQKEKEQTELNSKIIEDMSSDNITKNIEMNETCDISSDYNSEGKEEKDPSEEKIALNSNETSEKIEFETKVNENSNKEQSNIIAKDSVDKDLVDTEYRRASHEKIEIVKDISQESDGVCLRKKGSPSTLARSDSFSVKEEIEKIERQIKELESRNASKEQENIDDVYQDDSITSTRLSIQETRRQFFENMVDGPSGPIKLEFKKLPREQKDIHVIKLTDPPIPVATSREPVKVIELHISEPIRHKTELLDEVNPIPKPRRHSALSLRDTSESRLKDESKNLKDSDNRGKSF